MLGGRRKRGGRGDTDRGEKRWRKKGRGGGQKEEGEETQPAPLNRPTELSSC